MSKINILNSSVYNKIAAGEVVERPASVVKELVENSLDAGAKNIIVSIKSGGKSFIEVTDDGYGIEPDDIKKAFYPHATSKIKESDDLFDINTLGFRGEALASIASVAMVQMKSRTPEFHTGWNLSVNGGIEQFYNEIACNVGTTVSVSNLFFNTPARLKFLKKDVHEEHEITNLVGRYILINHHVSFKYVVDEKVVYQTSGGGLKDAIYIVYGKETVNNLIELKNEYKGMRISGYISKPTYFKSNKNYQTVSLNSRYIMNSQVSIAVNNAYGDYLMKRSYPFYVLEIYMPNSVVDVNVHPNKTDVRFENSQDVFKMVYGSVSYTINEYNKNKISEISNDLKIFPVKTSLVESNISDDENKKSAFENTEHKQIEREHNYRENFLNLQIHDFDYSNIDKNKQESAIDSNDEIKQEQTTQENIDLPLSYSIIGQVFSAYIIVECIDKLYVIDQHAAHERFLYDKIMLEYENKNQFQDLLIPYVFHVSTIENEFLKENMEIILELGFCIQEFGANTYKVNSVPMYFYGENVAGFIREILHDMKNIEKLKDIDIVKNNLMQKACKAAIKSGKQLSDSEIRFLINDIKSGNVLQCPHGRPVIYSLSKRDVEKWFKRIM